MAFALALPYVDTIFASDNVKTKSLEREYPLCKPFLDSLPWISREVLANLTKIAPSTTTALTLSPAVLANLSRDVVVNRLFPAAEVSFKGQHKVALGALCCWLIGM